MKKRYGAGLLLVLCIVMLAACGNAGKVETSQTGASQMKMSPTSMGSMSASPTNTSQAKAVEVRITLSDFHITSSLTTFVPGVPYHFTVTNKGKVAHELMLMSTTMKTMGMSGLSMKTMDQMALATLEAMSPGETKTFTYTFTLSTTGPHPGFTCYLPGHYEAGMYLDVTVSNKQSERSSGGSMLPPF